MRTSWIGGLHFYWGNEAKTELMCNGYRVPDGYIRPIEKKVGPIDTWDPRLEAVNRGKA